MRHPGTDRKWTLDRRAVGRGLATAWLLAAAACSGGDADGPARAGDAAAGPAAGDGGAALRTEAGAASPAGPPVEGDGRLVDVGDEPVGGPKIGWDSCLGDLSRRQPTCTTCPPATRGSSYLVFQGAGPKRAGTDSQAYFWFEPPLPAEQPLGLWFDVVKLGRAGTEASFSAYYVSVVCETEALAGTVKLGKLLATPGKWASGCVPLKPSKAASRIGVRLDGAEIDVGIDAIRFGPACPGE